jgi:hypothetical protein
VAQHLSRLRGVKVTLLSRLQSATGPSRELDAEIALAKYPWLNDCPRDDRDGDPGWMTKDGRVYALRYTECTDAVMTLVLDNFDYWVGRYSGVGRASITNRDIGMWIDGQGATPAIALLIAIERAKEDR